MKPEEPPRSALMRQLFYLLENKKQDQDPIYRHAWATNLLGRPINTFTTLTTADLYALIDDLVLSQGTTRQCRSISKDDQQCILRWPYHPLWCVDIDGNEWLSEEI